MAACRLKHRGVLVYLVTFCCMSCSLTGNAQESGVIVETVTADSIAARAGVKVGDRLLTYGNRPLLSPYALRAGIENTFGSDALPLRVQHDNAIQALMVAHGNLGVIVRAEMTAAVQKLYAEGLDLKKQGKQAEAAEKWDTAAQQAKLEGENAAAAWLYGQIGQQKEDAKQWKDAQSDYGIALTLAQTSKDRAAQAQILSALGRCSKNLNDLNRAQEAYEQAQRVNEDAGNEWWVAQDFNNHGIVAFSRYEVSHLQADEDRAEADFKRANEIWHRLSPDSLDEANSLTNLGVMARNRGKLDEAEQYCKHALAIQQKFDPESAAVANTYGNLGEIAFSRANFDAAEKYQKQALTILQKHFSDRGGIAFVLGNLGGIKQAEKKYFEAEKYYRDALSNFEKLTPDSQNVVTVLNILGSITYSEDKYSEAEDYLKRALDLQRKLLMQQNLDPDSAGTANILSNLGAIASGRGHFTDAEHYDAESLKIREKLAPNSQDVATSLTNLAIVAEKQGDLGQAEDYYRRALAILKGLNAAPGALAVLLQDLGTLSTSRVDLDAAADYTKRALRIYKQMDPGSPEVAQCLMNLGSNDIARGHLLDGEKKYREALDKAAPDSLKYALCLGNLAEIARRQRHLDTAETYARRGLTLYKKLAPDSLDVAWSLVKLGFVVYDRHHFADARYYFECARQIQQKWAPNSLDLADTLSRLGAVAFTEHRYTEALNYFQPAAEIVEQQRSKVLTADDRAQLTEDNMHPFNGLLQTYLARGGAEALANAFHTLERQRARSLVEMLRERSIDLSRDVPGELLKRQQELKEEDEDCSRQIRNMNPKTNRQDRETLYARQTQNEVQQQKLEAEIRRVAPRYAALKYPQPLTAQQAQHEALDPGTVLLAYSVQEDQTFLFTMTCNSLQVYHVHITEKDLKSLVDKFASCCSDPDAHYVPQARDLYTLLIQPAQKEVDAAKRLLISPDAFLHRLPFAALLDPTDHFLIQNKPLHYVVSLGVYTQLKRDRTDKRVASGRVMVVANPVYLQEQLKKGTGVAQRPSTLHRSRKMGGSLEPLEKTHDLAVTIRKLSGAQAIVKEGKEATKKAVLTEGPKATILFFACHGLLDSRHPEDSALALTPEKGAKKEEGYLHAYEVMEQLKLHADLVVLGGCETGLGQETRSEGIVGMTRAFEYAGAASVAATLWSVEVNSATDLMKGFYKKLRVGKSKDVALQETQTELLMRRRHPCDWAAFTLYGEWK